LSVRVIAEIMGWEENHVEDIIHRYVGRTAAIKATIKKLNDSTVTRDKIELGEE
jgi:hypothetical protein